MSSKTIELTGTEIQTKTRTLLALWDLGCANTEVKKSELTNRVKRTNEKARDYQSIFDKLAEEGAIALVTNKRVAMVSLTEQGLQMLGEGLKSSKFEYDTSVGAKTVNALLKWMRQMDDAVSSKAVESKAAKPAITSYKQFEQLLLEGYNQLNRDYNLGDLVPIYRLRREISDHISRSQFNEWLLEMQEKDILQLMAGEMPDITSDKREDSITIPGAGLRYYAKRLS